MADEADKDCGFKVEDKRRFDATGNARTVDETDLPDAGDRPEDRSAGGEIGVAGGGADGVSASDEGEPSRQESEAGQAGELTFSSFVIGLASQAFMFLGLAPDPQGGVVRQDLPQAKAMIDILGMLAAKTVGNLDEDEGHMMEEMLYELRLQYVKALKGSGHTPQEDSR